MKKKVAILGSTGSIGKSLLKIINDNKNKFDVVLITANNNYRELLKQARLYKVKNVIINNEKSYQKFIYLNKNKNLKIYKNFNNLNKIFKKKVDYTMSAITGIEGLDPTIKILKLSKKIAIANKESIICGWNLIEKELVKNKTEFIPVDSEHFSIWYSLRDKKINNINDLYLTASGGPFYDLPLKKFKNIKIRDALNHPNWKMGRKISIDSATMMNKVFEVIEAKNIFRIPYKKIKIIIHPKSYVHALIKFNSGMIKIVAHQTSMVIPIYNTIFSNEKKNLITKKIDFEKLNNLNFKKLETTRYPAVEILNNLPNRSSLFETIVVSANDEYVKLFLQKKISFNDISKKLLKFINSIEFKKYKKIIPKNVNQILKLNKYVRLKINSNSI